MLATLHPHDVGERDSQASLPRIGAHSHEAVGTNHGVGELSLMTVMRHKQNAFIAEDRSLSEELACRQQRKEVTPLVPATNTLAPSLATWVTKPPSIDPTCASPVIWPVATSYRRS